MNEIFVNISGYEGKYQISNFGRLRSIKRKSQKVTYLKGYITQTGYRQVNLWKIKINLQTFIHVLVAECFVPGKTVERNCVNHKDGNKLNNHFSNLEWLSKSENLKHAHTTGLIDNKGEKSILSVISDKQVLEIRKLYHKSSCRQIAKIYNLSPGHISAIVVGRRWAHLPLEDYSNRKPLKRGKRQKDIIY